MILILVFVLFPVLSIPLIGRWGFMLAFNVTSQPTKPVYLDRDEGQKISFFCTVYFWCLLLRLWSVQFFPSLLGSIVKLSFSYPPSATIFPPIRYFPPFPSPILFSSTDQIFSFSKYFPSLLSLLRCWSKIFLLRIFSCFSFSILLLLRWPNIFILQIFPLFPFSFSPPPQQENKIFSFYKYCFPFPSN